MVNPLDQGMEATKKAIAIFEGKKPNEIEISTPSSKYYFDYKILEKYQINSSKIPLLSTIVNEPKSFFEENIYNILPFLIPL